MTTCWTAQNGALAAAAENVSVEDMREALAAGAHARYLTRQQDCSLISMPHFVVSRPSYDCDPDDHSARQAAALRLLAAHGGLDAALATEALCQYWSEGAFLPAVVQVLLEAGADVRMRDAKGRTALHCAGNTAVTRMLIAAGADVNAVALPAALCCTPLGSRVTAELQCFPRAGLEVAAALLEAGADVDAVDILGRTCVKAALDHRNGSLVPMLLRAGADPTRPDNDGETALTVALARHHDCYGYYRASASKEVRQSRRIVRLLVTGAAWRRRRHLLLAVGRR